MGMGPFDSFSFPGVYTRTLNEPPRATGAGGLRFPAFIGVADEAVPVNNYEIIRGSSSMADNKIVKEDVSSQLTGTNREFTVSFFPIVSGLGIGAVTNDPNNIEVLINGEKVPVASVDGVTGLVNLVSIPRSDDEVLCSYYYKKTDTQYTEDLSAQSDGSRVAFKVFHTPIVQGDNGGITTTDPSKVSVLVNSVSVSVESVDGDNGIITLATAPSAGSTVEVSYFSNEHQDTSDILPSPRVESILSIGYSPGRSDFVADTDFVLDTSGTFSTINWGHSSKIASGQATLGGVVFDDTQITSTLYDNRIYRRVASGTADGTNSIFTIEGTPVSGQGLGFSTDDPSLIQAYVGSSPVDASSIGVLSVDPVTKTIVLASAPEIDATVFVTQYSNMLPDGVWTLTVEISGGGGVGEYSVVGEVGTAYDVRWSSSDTTVADPSFGTENVTYPSGTGASNRDTQIIPGYAPAGGEVVTLTFIDSSSYTVSSSVANGTGSAGDNTGYLNQTYIDLRTGFQVTILQGSSVIYATGDTIGYEVSSVFIAGSVTRGIPGIRVSVSDTVGVVIGDTATISTYNKSGNEPRIGDFYYVSFTERKAFDEDGLLKAQLFTLEKDALAFTGPLSITNKLGMAAHLCFLNGASAVALLQIQKTSGGVDAPVSRYIKGIDYFDEPMIGGYRPSLMQPVTTNQQVLNYAKTSNIIQSGIRYANERMTYFGFPLNTTPSSAQSYARSLASERMIGIYPDGAVTIVTDELGRDTEYLVDGALLGAAISGRDTSPAFDVAEPLTRKPIVGFTRLYRRTDSVTSAQTASSGLTILEEMAANISIKIDLTTDTTSVLTRTPSVIRIKDFVQKGTRSILQPYVGQKFLISRTTEIERTLRSYLGSLRQANIITTFTGVKAVVNANDPTTIDVEAFYSPVLPVLWIVVTYNLRSGL